MTGLYFRKIRLLLGVRNKKIGLVVRISVRRGLRDNYGEVEKEGFQVSCQ